MALTHSPSIVRDGMVLCLDAANPKSYPGSGTTWTDLSLQRYSANLVNDPAYDSNNKGSIAISNTSSYVSLTSPSSRWSWTPSGSTEPNTLSIEMWVKSSDSSGYYLSKPWNGNGEYNYFIQATSFYSGVGDQGHSLSFSSLATGNWEHIICIINPTQKAVYRNGVLNAGYTSHGITNNTTTYGNNAISLTLMTLYPYGVWAGNSTFTIAGNLGMFRIYNRTLTDNEVSKNFNAFKGRYGL